MRSELDMTYICHAPRRACELKFANMDYVVTERPGHAPRRACELKYLLADEQIADFNVTPHAGRVS